MALVGISVAEWRLMGASQANLTPLSHLWLVCSFSGWFQEVSNRYDSVGNSATKRWYRGYLIGSTCNWLLLPSGTSQVAAISLATLLCSWPQGQLWWLWFWLLPQLPGGNPSILLCPVVTVVGAGVWQLSIKCPNGQLQQHPLFKGEKGAEKVLFLFFLLVFKNIVGSSQLSK